MSCRWDSWLPQVLVTLCYMNTDRNTSQALRWLLRPNAKKAHFSSVCGSAWSQITWGQGRTSKGKLYLPACVLYVKSLNIVPPLWDGSPYVTELPGVSRNHLPVASSHWSHFSPFHIAFQLNRLSSTNNFKVILILSKSIYRFLYLIEFYFWSKFNVAR